MERDKWRERRQATGLGKESGRINFLYLFFSFENKKASQGFYLENYFLQPTRCLGISFDITGSWNQHEIEISAGPKRAH